LSQADVCEANVQTITSYWPEVDAEARLQAADETVGMHAAAYFDAQLTSVNAELKTVLHRLQQAAMMHNQFCATSDSILVDLDYNDDLGSNNFRTICDMRRQFDALYNRDKNHILARPHQEIESLRESFNN